MYCVIATDQMRTLVYLIVEGTFGTNSVNNLVTLLRFLTPQSIMSITLARYFISGWKKMRSMVMILNNMRFDKCLLPFMCLRDKYLTKN